MGRSLALGQRVDNSPVTPPPPPSPPPPPNLNSGTTIRSLARSLPLFLNLPEPVGFSLVLCHKAGLLSPGLIATPHTLWVCHTPHEPLQPYDHSTAQCSPFAFLQLHKFLHCSRSQDDRSNQASRLECHFTIAWKGFANGRDCCHLSLSVPDCSYYKEKKMNRTSKIPFLSTPWADFDALHC